MKMTGANLIRRAGLSAMVAGSIFAVVGLIHPPQVVSSVTTSTWTIVHLLTIVMAFFGLLGIAGHLRQASGKGGLAGSGRLSPVEPLVCARDGLYLLRSLHLAAPGERLTEVCGELPGDLHRVRRRDQRRSPGNALDATRGRVHPREPAVRHRHVPRRHPVALGGRPAWPGGRVISSVCAASAVVRAARGGAGGARSGMAGIFALVRTARASCATRTCQRARAAPPNPSR